MMHAHGQSIAASALTHRQMGMAGQYHELSGAIDATELGAIGADAGSAFLASGGDVDKLYEPTFKALSVLSLAIPQPGGALVSAGISGAKIGLDAIRGEIKEAFRAAGKYLPVDVSGKVTKELVSSPASYWADAARDKFSQYASGGSFLITAAIAAYNATVSEENKLNVGIRSRLGDAIYKLAKSKGATDWQAAMCAYRVLTNTGASSAEKEPYANKIWQALDYSSAAASVDAQTPAWKAAEAAQKQAEAELKAAALEKNLQKLEAAQKKTQAAIAKKKQISKQNKSLLAKKAGNQGKTMAGLVGTASLPAITNFDQAEAAWKKLVGYSDGAVVNATQAKVLPPAGTVVPTDAADFGGEGSNATTIAAIAGATLVAVVLLTRKSGGTSGAA